jgi:glycosyl hydrolase family 28
VKIATGMNWAVAWLTFTTVSVISLPASGGVTTYPAPPGEAVTGDYTVTVNGKPVDVYAAQSEHFDGDYRFASFDLSGKVEIRVTSELPLDNAAIQPASSAVQVKQRGSKEMTLAADAPFRISIERNGRIKPLLLFGNAEETDVPQFDDPDVVYFPPGVHRPGKITLTDNQTLYLAGGAVVKGCVLAQGENITIRGRGMLAGEDSPRFKGPGRFMLDCRDCKSVTIRDITFRNPWSWTLVTWNCDGVLIDNVKICASRMINDDALDLVNTQNAAVRNCFFRSQDDCIAIKGRAKTGLPCENILIEDCTFWTDVANIFRIGYECETPGMRNITARNIDVLHYSEYREPTDYWAHAIIWLQPNQDMVMEECHFENLRVRSSGDDIVMLMAKPMRCSYGPYKNPEPGTLRNCSLKNIEVHGEQGNFHGLLYLLGDSEKHDVSGMLFEHITYFGRPVTQDSLCVRIGPYVSDVGFRK